MKMYLKIASYKGVRQYLVERQQAMAAVGGVILDGRDIGSVVLPDAELKNIFNCFRGCSC